MADTVLKVTGLTSGYGDVQVLWGIDFEVRQGEIACIVGANGAGKSTLLRTISGLVVATGGEVLFQGVPITGFTPDKVLQLGIAQVPEGRRLFKGLSVRDNLLLGAYLRKDTAAVQKDLDMVFGIFPILKEREGQDASTLSGGEQQMCAVGRGIISSPKLLMIDEFSLGLAPQAVEGLSEALLEINKTGITVLVVEQDVMTAMELSDHAVVIETGRVVMSGPAKKVADDPKIRQAYMGI
jgi:branched-chain amino acid transport system ATP-binding protein